MAGLIPQSFIDDLLARVDIVDVVEARVPLKKKGANHHACCPFHNEKTPSFTVSQSKQFYHCFGCGAHGSAIGFLMEFDRLGFVEAIEMLAAEQGLEVPREGGDEARQVDHSPLYTALAACDAFYRQQLRAAPRAVDYLKGRGLSGATAKRFGLGYAPEGWNNLDPVADSAALQHAGMLAGEGRRYDRFRDRITFPIRDRRGRVIGFGARVIDQGEPKYLNSPETPLFHKGTSLYGIFELQQAVRKPERVLVVEGYMDVVALANQGIDYAVATLGTATTTHHVNALFKLAHDIVFCFDGDRAGREAAWRALNNTLPALRDGREARFLFLPDGEDPDSYVNAHGQSGFEALLDTATPLADFLLQHLGAADTRSIGERARLAEQATPLIAKLPHGVYRDLLNQRIQEAVGTGVRAPPATTQPRLATKPDGKRLTPIRAALSMIVQFPNLVAELDPEAFECSDSDPASPVFYKLVGIAASLSRPTTATLLERFRDDPLHDALAQLATEQLPDGRDYDAAEARSLLEESLDRLRRTARADEAASLLQNRHLGELSQEERDRYRRLLRESKG
ncbi:MAG: DNA primase [Pseudomonadota bacterium]